MIVHYPMNTAVLSEARLYALESAQYTAEYPGYSDKGKRERITHGKFGEYWVSEFCRLNGIPYQKDTTSFKKHDEMDVIVRGNRIDVKTSINPRFVGQVSPGCIGSKCDYFCFLLTDKECSYIAPYGLIEADEYRNISVNVKRGETIPGTTITQQFEQGSYFLPEDAQLIPFVKFMKSGSVNRRVIQPSTMVDGRDMSAIDDRMGRIEQILIQFVSSSAARSSAKHAGNVIRLATHSDLFGSAEA